MKQIDLREGARRQHRVIALLAMIHCWMRRLDGVVFARAELLRLLGLKHFKLTRVDWLEEDFREYFQFVELRFCPDKRNSEGELNSLDSLWVSRRPIGTLPPIQFKWSIEKLLRYIPAGGPRMEVFSMWPLARAEVFQASFDSGVAAQAESVNFDERLLASYLSLLSQGQMSPRSLPSLRKTD